MKALTIGQMAKETGLTTVTIRFYEKSGLLPKLERSSSGYRLYPKSLIPRFYFIKNAKSVGFELSEIKYLLSIQEKNLSSKQVKDTVQAKINNIDIKIKTLIKMKEALHVWDDACDGLVDLEDCPILENLYYMPDELGNSHHEK